MVVLTNFYTEVGVTNAHERQQGGSDTQVDQMLKILLFGQEEIRKLLIQLGSNIQSLKTDVWDLDRQITSLVVRVARVENRSKQ